MKATEFTELVGKASGMLIGLVYLWVIQDSEPLLWGWFLLVMVALGIPHGAIDHLLYHQKVNRKNSLQKFLLIYLGIMFIYLACWLYLPIIALVLFLIISAYHFGQANFIHIQVVRNKQILYLSTGFYYLAVILFGDFEQTSEILRTMVDIEFLRPYSTTLIISLFSLSSLFIVSLNSQKKYYYLIELSLLGLILYLMPLMLAFITYFGFWHSWPSLMEEYKRLTFEGKKHRLQSFVVQLVPFSLISLFGIAVILIFFDKWLTEKELTMLFFIMVSLISAPHIWIMDKFLENSSEKHMEVTK